MIIKYLKIRRMLLDIEKNENICENLSNLYHSKFKIDNIGRFYSVINPDIKDGKYDNTARIFDDTRGQVDTTYMQNWLLERLSIAKSFIINNEFFDLLTYSIDKLDNNNNFLVKLTPIFYDSFMKELKIVGISLLLVVIIGILLIIF